MKLALLVLGFIAVCAAVKWHQLEEYTFEHYETEFKRSYTRAEREFRRQIVEKKLKQIREHNNDPQFTWKRGVNHLTDRTEDEFTSMLGLNKGLLHSRKAKSVSAHYSAKVDARAFAGANIDWRQAGIVTPVKDQGQCGSCWTFATAETVESYWAKSTGQLVDLSEQQILDCTPNPNDCGGTGGCGGGTVELALDQIIKSGLSTEWTYPYYSYYGNNQSCQTVTPFAKVAKYVDIKVNDYPSVLSAITTVGPLAISVDAATWSDYESGVFDGCNKDAPDLDHAVQLVGVGNDPQLGDYWLVRNSWSPAWGENGYIRLARQAVPTCGTDKTPSDGDGCNNGPPEVTVCGTCGILYDTLYAVVQS